MRRTLHCATAPVGKRTGTAQYNCGVIAEAGVDIPVGDGLTVGLRDITGSEGADAGDAATVACLCGGSVGCGTGMGLFVAFGIGTT